MRPINCEADIEEGLAWLAESDSRLGAALQAAGTVPLRLVAPGFAGLASIIVSQQVTRASAAAIYRRLADLLDPLEPEILLKADDATFREAGLSRPKQRALRNAAAAIVRGEIDLLALRHAHPDKAMASLCAVKGIGPWTAEIYLMFCAGNRDIFPAGDLALREAARMVLGLAERPSDRDLRRIAARWTPWRSVAARLLWAYYRERQAGRGTMPI